MANLYKDQINKMLTDPSSFSGTPGFQFALNTGLDATARSNSAGRNSGNALAALAGYGSGLATQDYGAQLGRLTALSGQQDQFDTTTQRNADDLELGRGQLANTAERNANDFTLGTNQNTNTATRNDQDFGLGMYRAGNDFSLGQGQNANTAMRDWNDFTLGQGQNANTAAKNQNDFNLGLDRSGIDWFNAGTNRGSAASNSWNNGQNTLLNWAKYSKPSPGFGVSY